jgi:hypothetical protein
MAASETLTLLCARSAVVSTAGTRASSPECCQGGRPKIRLFRTNNDVTSIGAEDLSLHGFPRLATFGRREVCPKPLCELSRQLIGNLREICIAHSSSVLVRDVIC